MGNHKNVYSFDEKKYAEEIITTGFPNGIINYDAIRIVAKYFREVEGLGKVRLEKRLIDFCLSQNPDFNPIAESYSIAKWVKIAMQNNLRYIKNVVITQDEMDIIKEIRDLKKRKILFVTLVMSKATKKGGTLKKKVQSTSDRYYIHYSKFQSIIDRLDFKITEMKLIEVLREFVISGLLSVYSAEKQTLMLNFTDDDSPAAITIDVDNILEYYKIYMGGDKIYCPNCGDEMVKKSNRQELCKKCYGETIRIKDAKRKRKERASVRS